MSVTGTTNTYNLLTNKQFSLSSSTKTDLSNIKVTDTNGLDVSECFGVVPNIVNINDDDITILGECNSSLEVKITKGVKKPVDCTFTGYTQIQESGLVIFEFSDKDDTDNIHPECCESLGFIPEIGVKNYYVCRWRDEIDPTDCNNYTSTGQFDENGFMVFDFITGGTVNSVPNAECCYNSGLVEETLNGLIHCVEEEVDECIKLEILDAPEEGDILFINSETNVETFAVPSAECCTVNGFNNRININGEIVCYNALVSEKPTITITSIDACCNEVNNTPPI